MAFNITAIMNVALASGAATKISNDLNKQLGNKKVNIDLNMANADSIKRIKADIEGAITSVESFGRQAGLAAKRFGAFSLAAGSMITLVSAIKKGTEEAIDFDRQMVKLVQVSNDSVSSIQGVVNEVTRLSTSLGVSSKDLIQAAVTLKQANLSIEDTRIALSALAKAALAPNFENFKNTTEGAIAILNQFKIGANNLESALGSVNAVAGEFAVEAGDIVEAIRKTGGAFKAAGGDLNELLGLFTSVRQTTRESAETISTGLRTIFTRIQRGNTVAALKEVGVQLRYTREEALALGNANLEQQFVGPYEAIRRLSVALSTLSSTDPKFSKIVEELGGYRQISKVIPLIQEFAVSQKAVNVAIAGSTSLSQNAGQAQLAYAVKLQKLKEEFNALIRSITQSSGFQKLFDTFVSGASAAIQLADALKPLIPLITAFAAVKVATGIGQFVKGFSTGITASPNPKIFNQNRFADGGVVKMKRGGVVPGTGSGDIVPALLEPGEVVIPKRFASGGVINLEDYQSGNKTPRLRNVIQVSLLKPGEGVSRQKASVSESGSIQSQSGVEVFIYGNQQPSVIKDTDIPYFTYNPNIGKDGLTLSEKVKNEASYLIAEGKNNSINTRNLFRKFSAIRGLEILKGITNGISGNGPQQLEGNLFEHYYNQKTKSKNASNKADFPIDSTSTAENLGKFITDAEGNPDKQAISKILGKNKYAYVELKRSIVPAVDIIKKESRIFAKEIAGIANITKPKNFKGDVLTIPKKKKATGGFIVPGVGNSDSVPMDLEEGSFVIRKNSVSKIGADNLSNMADKRFASGGRVPSLLTPGEFVFSPSSASSIGSSNLDRMNKFGKFALGGRVGFASGGPLDPRLLVTQQQENLVFKNKNFNLESFVGAQAGTNQSQQYQNAEKALTEIIYEQIRSIRVDISQNQAKSVANKMATDSLNKLEKLNTKILTATSAVSTATSSSRYTNPNLDPSVISAKTRLDKLKKEKETLVSSFSAQALPTGEQAYRFAPAEEVNFQTGKTRFGNETIASKLSARTEERLGKVVSKKDEALLLGTNTKQRFLAEEENKLKQQTILAIAEQLKTLTGINDKEILIEAATQKYAIAVQQNAAIVEKEGRIFGLESLEKDIKDAGKKVTDSARGISNDFRVGTGLFSGLRPAFASLKSAISDFTTEVRSNGILSGLTKTTVGRTIGAVGLVGSAYGGEALSYAAGTAEAAATGQQSSARYTAFSALGSALSDAGMAATTASVSMNPLIIGLAAVAGGVYGFFKQLFNARAEIEKIRIDKAVDRINQSLGDLVGNKEFLPTQGLESSQLKNFLSSYKQERAAIITAAGSIDPEQLKNEIKGKFSGGIQNITQVIQDRLRNIAAGQKIDAPELLKTFKINPINADLINYLGDASGKTGDELDKLTFNLVKAIADEQKLEQVRQNAIAAADRFSVSLEFLSNSIESAVSKFDVASSKMISVIDVLNRSAEFKSPDIKSRVKFGSDERTFSTAIRQVFSPFGEQANPQIAQADVLNKFVLELPSVLATIKSQGGLEGVDNTTQLEKLLSGRGINIGEGFGRDLLQVVTEYLEKNQASLTRRGAAFDPAKAAKEALQSQIQDFQNTVNATSDAITKVGQSYVNGLVKIEQENQRYLSELEKVSEATANVAKLEAELQASRTGLPTSKFLKPEDITRPFIEKQRNLGVAGGAETNAQQIFNEMKKAQEEVVSTSKNLDESFISLASGSKDQREKARALIEANQNAKNRVANFADALKNLRDETLRASEAQSRLTEAEQQREAKLSAARTLLTADKSQLKQIERGRGIAQAVEGGADIRGFSRKKIQEFLSFTDTFKDVRLREFGGRTGQEIQNRAYAKAFPELGINEEQKKADQARQDLITIAKEQKIAAELYAQFIKEGQTDIDKLKKISDTFISDLERIFTQEIQRRQKIEEINKEAKLQELIKTQTAKETLTGTQLPSGKTFADILKGSTSEEEKNRIQSAKGVLERSGTLKEDLGIIKTSAGLGNQASIKLLSMLEKGNFAQISERGLPPEVLSALNRIKFVGQGGGIGAENVRNQLVVSLLKDSNLDIGKLASATAILSETSVRFPISQDNLSKEMSLLGSELAKIRIALYGTIGGNALNIANAFGINQQSLVSNLKPLIQGASAAGSLFGIPRFNEGGEVGGIGNRDNKLALLTPGEYVVPKSAYAKNGGLIRYLSDGGEIEKIFNSGKVFRKEYFFDPVKKKQLEEFLLKRTKTYFPNVDISKFNLVGGKTNYAYFTPHNRAISLNFGALRERGYLKEIEGALKHEGFHAFDYDSKRKVFKSTELFEKSPTLKAFREKYKIDFLKNRLDKRLDISENIFYKYGEEALGIDAKKLSPEEFNKKYKSLSRNDIKKLKIAYMSAPHEIAARAFTGSSSSDIDKIPENIRKEIIEGVGLKYKKLPETRRKEALARLQEIKDFRRKEFNAKVFKFGKDLLTGGFNRTVGAYNYVASGFGNVGQAISSRAAGAYNYVASGLGNARQAISSRTAGAYNYVASGLGNVGQAISSRAAGAYNYVASGFGNARQAISSRTAGAYNYVASGLGNARQAISNRFFPSAPASNPFQLIPTLATPPSQNPLTTPAINPLNPFLPVTPAAPKTTPQNPLTTPAAATKFPFFKGAGNLLVKALLPTTAAGLIGYFGGPYMGDLATSASMLGGGIASMFPKQIFSGIKNLTGKAGGVLSPLLDSGRTGLGSLFNAGKTKIGSLYNMGKQGFNYTMGGIGSGLSKIYDKTPSFGQKIVSGFKSPAVAMAALFSGLSALREFGSGRKGFGEAIGGEAQNLLALPLLAAAPPLIAGISTIATSPFYALSKIPKLDRYVAGFRFNQFGWGRALGASRTLVGGLGTGYASLQGLAQMFTGQAGKDYGGLFSAGAQQSQIGMATYEKLSALAKTGDPTAIKQLEFLQKYGPSSVQVAGSLGRAIVPEMMMQNATTASTATTAGGIIKDRILQETAGTGVAAATIGLGGAALLTGPIGAALAAGYLSKIILTSWLTAGSEAQLNKLMNEKRDSLLSLQEKLPNRIKNKVSKSDFDKIPADKWPTLADLDFMYETGAQGANEDEIQILDKKPKFSFPAAREYQRLQRSMQYMKESGNYPGLFWGDALLRAEQVFSFISMQSSNEKAMTDAILRASQNIFGERGETLSKEGKWAGAKIDPEKIKLAGETGNAVELLKKSFLSNRWDNLRYLMSLVGRYGIPTKGFRSIFQNVTGIDTSFPEESGFDYISSLFSEEPTDPEMRDYLPGKLGKRKHEDTALRIGDATRDANGIVKYKQGKDPKVYKGATREEASRIVEDIFYSGVFNDFFGISKFKNTYSLIKLFNEKGIKFSDVKEPAVTEVQKPKNQTPISPKQRELFEEPKNKPTPAEIKEGFVKPTVSPQLSPDEQWLKLTELQEKRRETLVRENPAYKKAYDNEKDLYEKHTSTVEYKNWEKANIEESAPLYAIYQKTKEYRDWNNAFHHLDKMYNDDYIYKQYKEAKLRTHNNKTIPQDEYEKLLKLEYKSSGGMIPTMLTPGEAVIPPRIAKNNLSLLNNINYRKSGGGIGIVKSGGKSHPLSKGTDTQFHYLEAGSYVVNKASTENNMGLLKGLSSGGVVYRAEGGNINEFDQNILNNAINAGPLQGLQLGLTNFAIIQAKKKKAGDLFKLHDRNTKGDYRRIKNEDFYPLYTAIEDYINSTINTQFENKNEIDIFENLKIEKVRRSESRPQLINKEADILNLIAAAKDDEQFTPEERARKIEQARNLQREVNSEKRYTKIVSSLVSLDRFGKRGKSDNAKEAEKYFDLAEIKTFADEKNKPALFKNRKDIDSSYFKDVVGIKSNVAIPSLLKPIITNFMKSRKIKGFYGSDNFQQVKFFDDSVYDKIGNQTIFLRRSDVDSIQEAAGRENKNRLNIIGDITDQQISGDVKRNRMGTDFIPDLTPEQIAEILPGSEIAFMAQQQAIGQGKEKKQRFKLMPIGITPLLPKPKGFYLGGYVNGASFGDGVDAKLRPGEFVLNPLAAQSIGYGNLNAINEQRFFNGGVAGGDRLFDKVTKSSSAQKLDQIDTKSFSDSVKMFDGGVNKFDSSIKSMGESITRLQSAINDLAKINIPEEINGNITVENNANIKIDSPNFAGEVNTVVSNAMSKIIKALENNTDGAISQADIFRDMGTA